MATKILLNIHLSLLVLIFLKVLAVSSFDVTITPPLLQITTVPTEVTITCNTDMALTGCQFEAWSFTAMRKVLHLDLSNGSQSYTNISTPFSRYQTPPLGFEYSGRRLEDGDCGVRLRVASAKRWIVGCRVKKRGGEWKYAWTELHARGGRQFPVTISDQEVIALPGEDRQVVCRGNLKECSFTLMSPMSSTKVYLPFHQGHRTPLKPTQRHIYHGEGLDSGDCGISLRNITEEDNGMGACNTWMGQRLGARHFAIIVAKPPSNPEFEVTYINNSLIATCTARDSRPVANMTWLLGGRTVQCDKNNDNKDLDAAWQWPWELATITQTLTIGTLMPQDHGEKLACVVHHVALNRSLEASTVIINNMLQPNVTCPKMATTSVQVSCARNGAPVLCSQPVPGTKALVSCKEGLISSSGEMKRMMTCQDIGEWTKPPLTCNHACGLRNEVSAFRILGGEVVGELGFPYHVAIFRKNPVNNQISLVCGGTLITTKHVLTAAHCFLGMDDSIVTDTALYRVVAGKQRRQWQAIDPLQQNKMVRKIHIHPQFIGHAGSLYADIAVVELRTTVALSSGVHVACVEWWEQKERVQQLVGSYGTVLGWGVTGNGTTSSDLLRVDLEIVSTPVCNATIHPDARDWLTSDKFCAGFKDRNISVCQGDSGGGLTLRKPSGRYVLVGVVSTSFQPGDHVVDTCYAQSYSAFTNVAEYVDWIASIVG